MDRFEKSLVFECAFTYKYVKQTSGREKDFWQIRFLTLKKALDTAIEETTIFIIVDDTMIYVWGASGLLYKIDISNRWSIIKF